MNIVAISLLYGIHTEFVLAIESCVTKLSIFVIVLNLQIEGSQKLFKFEYKNDSLR